MKTKQVVKNTRNRYSAEFEKQALAGAEKVGIALAARDLGLSESQLYAWRWRQRPERLTNEEENLQRAELARLKREVKRLQEEAAFPKKSAAYFARQPK